MSVPAKPLGGPGYDLVETAIKAIERYRMIDPGETVLVAVSGGPDSTCLFDVLWRLTERFALSLVIAHVDHGLSASSAEIAARVAGQGAADGFEVHTVRAPDLEGSNLHARAREFRYGFFDIVAEQTGATKLATGHTLDDRVETTLARFVHGAGTGALGGIPPKEGRRIRPLIGARRAEILRYCREAGLEYDRDPANDNVRFERAVVRNEVLSTIEDHWGEGSIRAMARSIERLREDASALDQFGQRLYSDLSQRTEDGTRFDIERFLDVPRALRHRLLDRAVGRVRDRSGGIEAVLDALESGRPRGPSRYAVAQGIEIVVDRDQVLVLRPPSDAQTT